MSFVTADQLICHGIGDYVLQSDFMAQQKTSKSYAALAHVITYTMPFLALTTSWKALLFIAGTHFVIDRWRLARYICWAKNWLAPQWIQVSYTTKIRNRSWEDCKLTGYAPDKPPFMAVWLLIIVDNLCHILLNGVAMRWLQ